MMDQEPHPDREAGLRFSRRIYPMRVLGLGLGGVCVASALLPGDVHPVVWLLLAGNSLLWPHLAYQIARNSLDPTSAERSNLLIDSAFGGAWIAAMQLNLLTSVVLLTMLSIDKVAAGGWRLLFRSWLGMLATFAITWTLLGFPLRPEVTTWNVLASIPFLISYPLALSLVTWRLGQQVVQQNRELQAFTRIDGLTGLPNRLHWEQAASQELRRHRRAGRPATLMMIDIDHFKPINDRYGHLVGDEVLKGFALDLRTSLREVDTAGRYGGDEFGVVLPDTGPEGASQAARRVLHHLRRRAADPDTAVPYTVSIGYALAESGMADTAAWIAAADAALYRAKAAGRDGSSC
jgi:diguanylate cyclase